MIQGLTAAGISFARNGGAHTLPGLISLSYPGIDGETLLHRLELMGISISTGAACDSVNTKISHVLEAMKLEELRAKGTIRISIGKNNSEKDALDLVDALVRIVR